MLLASRKLAAMLGARRWGRAVCSRPQAKQVCRRAGAVPAGHKVPSWAVMRHRSFAKSLLGQPGDPDRETAPRFG